MIETQSCGGIVLNPNGKILVVSQHGTSWSLPKGHIEDGEDKIATAKREIYEESGITDLTLIRELGSYQRNKIALDGTSDTSELKTIFMFLFKTNENAIKPIDPENPEARWVAKEEVEELLTHEKDKAFFRLIAGQI